MKPLYIRFTVFLILVVLGCIGLWFRIDRFQQGWNNTNQQIDSLDRSNAERQRKLDELRRNADEAMNPKVPVQEKKRP
jgi:hypothetical protein